MVDQAEDETPSLDFVRQILRQRAPAAIDAYALQWSSYFHVHRRQVADMQGQIAAGRNVRRHGAGECQHVDCI
jgi:hypothetical protein